MGLPREAGRWEENSLQVAAKSYAELPKRCCWHQPDGLIQATPSAPAVLYRCCHCGREAKAGCEYEADTGHGPHAPPNLTKMVERTLPDDPCTVRER